MNAESGLTYDGTSLTVDNRIDIAGTLPTLQIGDGGDEDIKLLFNSNTNDYYIGSDATDDKLHIGVGSTIGTNSAMVINSGSFVEFPKGLRHSPSVWVGTTANDSSAQNRFMKIAEHTVGLSPSAYASANAVLLVTMCGLGHTGYDIFQTWMVVVQWGESNNTVTSGAPATKISARLLDSSESDELAMDPSFFTLTYNGTTEAAVWVKSPYGYIDVSITHLGGSPSRVGGDVAIGTTSGAAAGWVLCDSTGDQDDWQTSITSLGADLVADYASQHVNEMMVEGSLLVSGSATIHTLTLTNTQDADQTDSSIPALRIGNVTGQHIQFDDNEIHAKSDATTGGPLYLQHNGGGSLSIGGGSISYGLVSIKAKGDTSSDGLAVYGNTSTNTVRIWTDASGNRRISGGSGDTGTIYINNTGGDLVVGDDLFVKGTGSSNQTDLRINTSTGALYHYSSTRKVKSNIQNHDVGLNEIIQLQPVIYERNSEPGVPEVGLIAEDVRSALGDDYVILGPDYTYDENGDYVWEDDTEGTAEGAPMGRKKKLDSEDTVPHDWDYRSVVTALIGAVKDLKEENDSLKARIEALES
ncbi:hypothetical protein CMK19_01420 [Candidatus Poribacteria bacterium]|nr:hypothetical protein [Candidatus Poribacteria bacterium]